MILFFNIFKFSFCSPDWKLMCRPGWRQIRRFPSVNKNTCQYSWPRIRWQSVWVVRQGDKERTDTGTVKRDQWLMHCVFSQGLGMQINALSFLSMSGSPDCSHPIPVFSASSLFKHLKLAFRVHAYKSALEVLQELLLPSDGTKCLSSVSLWRWACVYVCAYLLHWTLDLGPDTCQACAVPYFHLPALCGPVYVGKYHSTCWRSKLWVSGIKLKLPILGKPLWLLSHYSSNSPPLKKSVILSRKAAQADLELAIVLP